MYKLNVLQELTTDSGTLYMPGHPCKQLNAFEAAYLLTKYPKHFEPADELTEDFAKDTTNLKHLADAKQRMDEG